MILNDFEHKKSIFLFIKFKNKYKTINNEGFRKKTIFFGSREMPQ